MDIERFTSLSDIYGGDISRWPEAEREAARALAGTDARAAEALAAWSALDDALHEWRTGPASTALRDAVLATAPSGVRASRSAPAWMRDLRLWFAGAGLAAGLAGVVCGAVLSTLAVREARDEALVASAVMDTPNASPLSTDATHRL